MIGQSIVRLTASLTALITLTAPLSQRYLNSSTVQHRGARQLHREGCCVLRAEGGLQRVDCESRIWQLHLADREPCKEWKGWAQVNLNLHNVSRDRSGILVFATVVPT